MFLFVFYSNGIFRLDKVSDNGGETQWRVFNSSSAVNSDININYEIPDFEPSGNNIYIV